MNKEYLKAILSTLCVVFGLVASIFSSYTIQSHEPSYILFLFLSLSLCLIGVVSFIMSYRRHQIIAQLKKSELPILARWQYTSKNYKLVALQLDENHYINVSIIFLIGVLGLLIILGLTFSGNPISIFLSILLTLILIVSCSISFYLIHGYYGQQLEKEFETIISSHYIYFNGELYSIQKGLYYLENIKVVHEGQYYLQFIYGAPGTPYGPFTTLTIPIPEGELATAYTIKEAYLSLITD